MLYKKTCVGLFSYVLLVLYLTQSAFSATINNLLESPCPDNFVYQYDENGLLYGSVKIQCPDEGSKIQLNVELSVGNNVEGYNGNIQLVYSKEKVVQDIMQRRPILYKVYFPMWSGIPPKVTKILVNGDLICRGPKISMGLVAVLTRITLQHTLRVDVQPLISSSDSFIPTSSSSDNNFDRPPPPRGNNRPPPLPENGYNRPPPPPDNQDYRPPPPPPDNGDRRPPPPPDNDDRRPPPPPDGYERRPPPPPSDYNFIPPEDDSPGGRRSDSPKRGASFGNNQFKFNPPPPKNGVATVHNINFNPQMPKDPSKIYPGNPFFNSLSSTSSPVRDVVGAGQSQPQPIPPRRTEKPPVVQRIDDSRSTSRPNRKGNITPSSVDLPVEKVDLATKDKGTIGNPYEDICGKTVTTNALVINGSIVPRGAYPWLVALFGVKATGLNYMCSGSLISDRHVVTAAHCVKTETKKLRPNELLIILGKLNIQKWVPTNGEKMIEPESIHIHSDYETMSSDADIAVLVLSESVQFTKYIRPLCLWSGENELNNVVGKEGTVVGWGKDENGDLMTAEPKQIDLPIVSQEQCLRSSYQFQYITSNRTFCAGFRNGSGPCNGDSGSGFVMKVDGRWMLRGIVSLSISESHTRTCDLSNYVVFTDASKYLSWLLSFIK